MIPMIPIALPNVTKVLVMPIVSARKPVLSNPIMEGRSATLKYMENTRPSIAGSIFSCSAVLNVAL